MKSTRKIALMVFAFSMLFSCEKERYIYEPGNLVPRTVDEDPGLPSITVNGVMLHAEAFGHPDSTMIVCIHGGPGADYRYLLHCKDLANHGYRVVFYDQRGSGLSQRLPRNSYSSLGSGAIDVMYDELSGVIAHYRTSPGQRVFLLGHSWGGMLATGYAGKYPHAIQGLIVCDPGGLKWEDVEVYIETSREFKLTGELLNNATYLDQFITGNEDQHEILDYKLALLASNNDVTGENNTDPASFWRSGAVIAYALLEIGEDYRPDFSAGIQNFHVPVLFLYAENNKAYPDSWAQRISGIYNSANLFKVMGAGHSGIITDQRIWTEITLPKMLDYFGSL